MCTYDFDSIQAWTRAVLHCSFQFVTKASRRPGLSSLLLTDWVSGGMELGCVEYGVKCHRTGLVLANCLTHLQGFLGA